MGGLMDTLPPNLPALERGYPWPRLDALSVLEGTRGVVWVVAYSSEGKAILGNHDRTGCPATSQRRAKRRDERMISTCATADDYIRAHGTTVQRESCDRTQVWRIDNHSKESLPQWRLTARLQDGYSQFPVALSVAWSQDGNFLAT